jgi:hypothetical protein
MTAMPSDNRPDPYEFDIETNFQRMARRPGGVTRDRAIQNADRNIETFKPGFETWLDNELARLLQTIPSDPAMQMNDLSWIPAADAKCQRLADVAATMDYQLMSFVANNLCLIFDAIRNGAAYRGDVIDCHVSALRLARQRQYRKMRSEDLPELSDGLRRILESPRLQPRMGEGA